jgi:hypothetical protein
LLQNLVNNGVVHIFGVGDNVIPGEMMILNLCLNLFFDVNGKIGLEKMMNDEVGMLMLSGDLNRKHS